MRLWAELNYSPHDTDNTLVASVFEALFCWDPEVAKVLPPAVRLYPGFKSMLEQCTGDPEMSLRVAIGVVSSLAARGEQKGSVLYGVKASDENPKWTTVRESWDTMYAAARKDKKLDLVLRWMSLFANTLEQSIGRMTTTSPIRRLTHVDDIGDTLPEDLALLASTHTVLRTEFIHKLIDGALVGMTRPAVVNKPSGPVFILLDQSKSMAFLDQRVKGLALAMFRVVLGSNRRCYIIPFSTMAAPRDKWYVGGDPSIFCQVFMGGGTSGLKAINDVLDVTDTLALSGSTIIMITDGAFSTTPRTRRELQRRLEESSAKVGFFMAGLSSSVSVNRLGKTVQLGNLSNLSLPTVSEIAGCIAV